MIDTQYKPPTFHMRQALLELLTIVEAHDNGQPGQPHDVKGVHHMTLKAMAKPSYGCLIALEASNSPSGVVWTVAMTHYGLKVAKSLRKGGAVTNDTAINTKRQLRTIQWQVDVNKPDGQAIYETAKQMKADRNESFTAVMNNMINLYKELKEGRVGMLQRLFPQAYTTLLLIARNEIELEHEDSISGLVDELKRHMLSQPVTTSEPTSAPKPLDVPQFSAPTFDDDEIELDVTKDEGAGDKAVQNFLSSVMNLQE